MKFNIHFLFLIITALILVVGPSSVHAEPDWPGQNSAGGGGGQFGGGSQGGSSGGGNNYDRGGWGHTPDPYGSETFALGGAKGGYTTRTPSGGWYDFDQENGDGRFLGRGDTPPPRGPVCSTNPNVVPENIYFELASLPGVHVAQADLEPGKVYIPKLEISNRGTLATNAVDSTTAPQAVTPSSGILGILGGTSAVTTCTNNGITYQEGDAIQTLNNADGTVSSIADASYVCRSGSWVVEGGLQPSSSNNTGAFNTLKNFFKGLIGEQVLAGGGDSDGGEGGGVNAGNLGTALDATNEVSLDAATAQEVADQANGVLGNTSTGGFGTSAGVVSNGNGGFGVSVDHDGGDGGGYVTGGSCPAVPSGPFFSNNTPFGSNGTFPVRLQIDIDRDGSFEYTNYLNEVGPLQGGQNIILSFPAITFTEDDLGTHDIIATVDLKDSEDPGHGCAGAWGCIAEYGNPTSNDLLETMVVTRPEIKLGSFLVGEVTRRGRDGEFMYTYLFPKEFSFGDRDITNVAFNNSIFYGFANGRSSEVIVKDVGLYWTGTKVDLRSCTGSTVDKDGTALSDFSGQPERSGRRVDRRQIAARINTNDFDIYIDEPSTDNYHLYTITCDTLAGGSVTDSIFINNGADITDLTILDPGLSDISVEQGQTLSIVPFTVANNSPADITDYSYTFSIDGTAIEQNTIRTTLPKSQHRRVAANTAWTAPDRVTTVPMQVCISHSDMTGNRCASATIHVVAPSTQCSDGVDNDGDGNVDMADANCTDPSDDSEAGEQPTITASPTLVRKGDEVTVSWEGVGPGCTLSAKLAGEDATTPGSATFTATGQTTITITCGSLSDSVTIKVLPELYET